MTGRIESVLHHLKSHGLDFQLSACLHKQFSLFSTLCSDFSQREVHLSSYHTDRCTRKGEPVTASATDRSSQTDRQVRIL